MSDSQMLNFKAVVSIESKGIEICSNEIIDGDYYTVGVLSTDLHWLKTLGYSSEPVKIKYNGKMTYWLQFDSPEVSAWYAIGDEVEPIPFDVGILPELLPTCPQYEQMLK